MARNSKAPEFEQALAELEKLVETLERGDLPLDEALRNFERGVELTRHCQSALKSAQQRVDLLLRRNGDTETVPFEEAPESRPADAVGQADATRQAETTVQVGASVQVELIPAAEAEALKP